MKKKTAVWCITGLIICLIGGCKLQQTQVTEPEKALPKLRIGSDEYEPYNYLDENGKGTGIDADLEKKSADEWDMNRSLFL